MMLISKNILKIFFKSFVFSLRLLLYSTFAALTFVVSLIQHLSKVYVSPS